MQLTVLLQPFASPRSFPARFLWGGCATAPPSLSLLRGDTWALPGCSGAGAARPCRSHTQSPPCMLRCSCSPSRSTADSLLPQGPPYHTPGCQAVFPECRGDGRVAPAARLQWGSCAPRHPPAHPCQLQQHSRERGLNSGVCQFPAWIQCFCDSQPCQMLMTKGTGMFSDEASSLHWKYQCCSLHGGALQTLGTKASAQREQSRCGFHSCLQAQGQAGKEGTGAPHCWLCLTLSRSCGNWQSSSETSWFPQISPGATPCRGLSAWSVSLSQLSHLQNRVTNLRAGQQLGGSHGR